MFFSDELLTGKKGSLGVIWLMATLGERNRRFTRKTLTNVEIPRACELISEPPEPLALRLSGTLLVGVARVYSKNCEIFFTDVQSFDASLRRSMATELRAAAPGSRGSGGIDLPGRGTSRIDQITFAPLDKDFDASTIFDFEFGHIDWSNPIVDSRKRRATSKLSSLPTLHSQREDEDSDEEMDDEDDSEVQRKRLKTASVRGQSHEPGYRTPGGDSHRRTPFDLDQEFEAPLDLGILDGDMLGDTSFAGNDGAPFSSDGIAGLDFGDGNDFDMQGIEPQDDQTTPSNGNKKRRERSGSAKSASDVEEELEPKTKKAKRKVKMVTFDDNLELHDRESNYARMMKKQKAEIVLKKHDNAIQIKATAMVDGGGLWMQFFDPEMGSLFNTLSKVDKFKWELDVEAVRAGKPAARTEVAGEDGNPPVPEDPFAGDNAMFDQGNAYMENYNDYEVPLNDPQRRGGSEAPSEIGRRQSQISSGQGVPWDPSTGAFDDLPDGVDMSSPGSRRFSVMTPQEIRIRSSTGTNGRRGSRGNVRSRSGSLLSNMPMDEDMMLAPLDNDELPADPEPDSENLNRGPFSPAMLATLEIQCRHYFTRVEATMIKAKSDEVDFTDTLRAPPTKAIAAASFYHCLTLATRRILTVHQVQSFGSISIRIAAE